MKESTDKIPDFDFTSFLNMVQEPIVILDKERKIIHFNDLFLKETKFKDKNLRDKPFIELLHPEDKEYVQTRFIEKENGNEVSNGFLTRLIDNGGVCRNIFMTSNLLIKQKELFGFCVTLKLSSSTGKFSEFFLRVQEISKSIAGTIEITELLTRICESIGRILDFPLVYVSLIHPDDKKLYPVAWHGKTRYFMKYENFVNLHNTENIPEYTVLKTGKILKLKLKNKLKSPYKAWLEILKSEKYTSYIGFPIIIKKKTEGVLNIFSEIPYLFGDSERVESLLTLTNFITVAIKNSRLFQKIIQAEERYRGLFYESPNGLCLINKDLQIHEINSIFLKMIGYSLKDFHVLSDFKKILTQNDYKKLNTFLNKSIKTKRSYSFDSVIKRREGEKRWVNLFISPLYDKFRNVIEFLLILRDVTEEKLSEFSILESEKKFRDLFENSSDVIFQIDKSGKLEKINNAFESISGYKVKNWIGKSFLKLFPKNMWKGTMQNVSRIISGLPLSWETTIRVKNKKLLYILLSVWPMRNLDGDIIGLWGSFKDISEMKKTQESLTLSNIDLEKANLQLGELIKVKTEFLESISHELKTPLVPIFGYLSLLKENNFGKISKEGIEAIDNSLKNLNRLNNVIQELIQMAEYQQATPIVNLKIIELKDLLFPVILNYVPIFKGKNLEFNYDTLPEESIFLKVDVEKMSEVFNQLLNNAFKFTDSGKIEIIVTKDEEKVHFKISDTGIGIPATEIKNIFDRFYQVDKGTRRKYLGIGIGLSIVKEVLLSHDSNIIVKTNVNEGTSFEFNLPIVSE